MWEVTRTACSLQHHDMLWLPHSAHPAPVPPASPCPCAPRLSHHPEGGSILAGKELRGGHWQGTAVGCAAGGSRGVIPAAPAGAHVRNWRVSPTPLTPPRPGDVWGHEHQGQAVWQSHPKHAQGTRPAAATYSSGCSQQQGGGKGEPGEREETQLLPWGSCCPSTHRTEQGQYKAALLTDTKHPCASSPPLRPPRPVSPWSIHPGWAVIFLQGFM